METTITTPKPFRIYWMRSRSRPDHVHAVRLYLMPHPITGEEALCAQCSCEGYFWANKQHVNAQCAHIRTALELFHTGLSGGTQAHPYETVEP